MNPPKTKDKKASTPKIEKTVKKQVDRFTSDLVQWVKGNSFSNGKSMVVDRDSLLKYLPITPLLDTKKE